MDGYGPVLVYKDEAYYFFNGDNKDKLSAKTYPVGRLLCNLCNVEMDQIRLIVNSYPDKDVLLITKEISDSLIFVNKSEIALSKAYKWLKSNAFVGLDPVITETILGDISEITYLIRSYEDIDDLFEEKERLEHIFSYLKKIDFFPFHSSSGSNSEKSFNPDHVAIISEHLKTISGLFDLILKYLFASLSLAKKTAIALVENDISKIRDLFNTLWSHQKTNYKAIFMDDGVYGYYKPYNIISLVCLDACKMMETNTIIKKCSNCGKYFVPVNRADTTIYCDDPSPQDPTKTCKKYGAVKQYQERLKLDEAKGLYRKIYMAKQMLKKRNPEIENYEIRFEEFKSNAKQWQKDVSSGIRTQEEYIDWLKEIKNQGNY